MPELADLALLRDVLSVLSRSGVSCFLIGAGARVLGLDERFGISGARATKDWDFAVRVNSWHEWHSLRERFFAAQGGSFSPTDSPHRFVHQEGRLLDLVPYGPLESPAGRIAWPDGTVMSVGGFSEAAAQCDTLEIEPGLRLQVACLPSLALLKLHAYLERRVEGTLRDIQDFDWLLRHYDASPGHEHRVDRELRGHLIAENIEYSESGATLLGLDVARIHAPNALEPLSGLLTEFGDPYGRPVQDVLRAHSLVNEAQEGRLRTQINARLEAFRRGVQTRSRA